MVRGRAKDVDDKKMEGIAGSGEIDASDFALIESHASEFPPTAITILARAVLP